METNQVIYIRTDGNTEIATGHIMRCLTIAKACQKKGARVVFIVSDAESETLLSSRMGDSPFPIIKLCTDYHDAEEELPVLCQILMSYPCTTLLIDSYFVNPGYLETLSRLTQVAYIDDLYRFPYPVQTIINYDIAPDPEADCYRLASRKLLGLSYTPIREMFERCSYTVRPKIQKILLIAGGMDNGRFFTDLIQMITRHFTTANVPDLTDAVPFSPELHVLTGASDMDPAFSAFVEDKPYVTLHEYAAHMADFLCQFDLVVTASGTTLYEICALGIPGISFVIADNQIPAATAFDLNNLVPCLGDLRAEGPYAEIMDKLLSAYDDYETRCACSARMQNAIDKKGADRIADALLH